MKILKPKIYPGENVRYCCAEILVHAERLESAKDFKTENLGCTTFIFDDTSNSIFRIQSIQKYKEVTDFIKKLCMCDMDVVSPEDIITYESLVQEFTHEYRNFVYSKWWEPATGKKSFKTNLHF